jgi:Uma2 family endonuclease
MAANPKDQPKHYFTLEEYLALENVRDARYEYWDGDIVCLSGGSQRHYRISANIHYRLRQRLEGSRYVAFTAQAPVRTPGMPPYRYPDASVTYRQPKFENVRGTDALVNPIVIVEVMSPATEERDTVEKFAAYKSIPGFEEYLLVAQDGPRVVHYRRQADGFWVRQPEISTLDGEITLSSVECTLSVASIYSGVTFPNIN